MGLGSMTRVWVGKGKGGGEHVSGSDRDAWWLVVPFTQGGSTEERGWRVWDSQRERHGLFVLLSQVTGITVRGCRVPSDPASSLDAASHTVHRYLLRTCSV